MCVVNRIIFGDKCRGQSGRGVVGHQRAQVGRDADRTWLGDLVNRVHNAPDSLRVARFVHWQEGREMRTGAWVDEVDAAKIPACEPNARAEQCAIRRELESDSSTVSAVARRWCARPGTKRASKCLG